MPGSGSWPSGQETIIGAAEQSGQQHEGMAHVVAVPDPRQAHGGEVDAPLPEREEVGHRLARMLQIREPVDDGDGGVAGQPLHGGVAIDAGHDAVHPAREVARDVRNRLSRAHADLAARQIDAPPTELNDTDLEGHPRAE